eukprot:scaffold228_cov312-Pinguiococcus_pyrenoidosus.AAC.38
MTPSAVCARAYFGGDAAPSRELQCVPSRRRRDTQLRFRVELSIAYTRWPADVNPNALGQARARIGWARANGTIFLNASQCSGVRVAEEPITGLSCGLFQLFQSAIHL